MPQWNTKLRSSFQKKSDKNFEKICDKKISKTMFEKKCSAKNLSLQPEGLIVMLDFGCFGVRVFQCLDFECLILNIGFSTVKLNWEFKTKLSSYSMSWVSLGLESENAELF